MRSDRAPARKRGRQETKTSPLARSQNMARIRGKDTQPEMRVRRALWAAGLRYRLHDKSLPGCPDLVFPGRHTVIMVHGCFFHMHEGCANFRLPKTRTKWWAAKLARNRARDAEVRAALEAAGWRIIVMWECETERAECLEALVQKVGIRNLLKQADEEGGYGER